MNYTIDIIDTTNDGHSLLLEHAEKSSVVLSYNGGDDKAEQNIVGSSLSFTMEVNIADSRDAFFADLFTGDEAKYKVRLYHTDSDLTVWTGHLLPDSYSEPYTNATFYVGFEATDGLGRLRGKYLPDAYYRNEYTVVQFIAQCLLLTGLQLPIRLAPAIVNAGNENYHEIYLDGAFFVDDGNKMNCYKVLTSILQSMLCTVFQADDLWYVEGFNKRHLETVVFYRYDYLGEFISHNKQVRLFKDLNPLDVPLVTMVPPIGRATVTHARRPQALPVTIAQEQNDGWTIGLGANGDIFPTFWYGAGGYWPKAIAPDYKVTLPCLADTDVDYSQYVSLRDKIYVRKYDNFSFSAKFKSKVSAKTDAGKTPNGFRLAFILNNDVLALLAYSFEEDEIEIAHDLYIENPGLLDINIIRPYFGGSYEDGTFSEYVVIEEMEMEVIGFKEEDRLVRIGHPNFTSERDLSVFFADDAAAFSPAFRLQKLKNSGNQYNEIEVPVLYGRTFNGEYYSTVSLFGANLVADNLDTTYYNGTLLTGISVIYNFLNGDEMVIKTPTAIVSGSFTVRRYRSEDVYGDRSGWEKWTDAVYPIETDRYIESVAKVLNRMFPVPHERVDFLSDNAIKFNDLVNFAYVLPRQYVPLNLSWNLDDGHTSGTMVRGVYQNSNIDVGTPNQPPIVNAGPDVVVDNDFGTGGGPFGPISLFLTGAEAYDPDGFITTWFWDIVHGAGGLRRTSSQAPELTNFVGNEITIRVTVTDSDGATASDTRTISRMNGYTLNLDEQLYYNTDGTEQSGLAYMRDVLTFSPSIVAGNAATIKGNFWLRHLRTTNPNGPYPGVSFFKVEKNGVQVIYNVLEEREGEKEGDFEFTYITGDVIRISIQNYASFEAYATSNYIDLRAGYEITGVSFNTGTGQAQGLPVEREVRYIGWVT